MLTHLEHATLHGSRLVELQRRLIVDGLSASGVIRRHDLALTATADKLGARAVNVHFEDWFEDNDIRFDYRMKPGPVSRSNALALMRAVGLEVATDANA